MSLCSVDEDALAAVDVGSSTARERVRMIHMLAESGVSVSVSAAPWIPGASDARAVVDAIGPGIAIRFAPLNVLAPKVAATPFGRRFSQRRINRSYLEAFREMGEVAGVSWLYPIPLDDDLDHHPFDGLLHFDQSDWTDQAVAELHDTLVSAGSTVSKSVDQPRCDS